MTEVSIAKPLSGPEALESCLQSLRTALGKDDRFSSHMSYNGFKAEIGFKFYPHLTFTPPVERDLTVEAGDQEGIEAEPTIDDVLDIPLRPPNQVREDADLPVPVLVTDGKGTSSEKWVKRGPRPENKARPKNQVRGA